MHKNNRSLLIMALLLQSLIAAVAYSGPLSGGYTLADLEILESEKNYREFFAHAQDIRPTKRDSYWNSMVNEMAESYSAELLKNPTITPKKFAFLEKLHKIPTLKNNEFFIKNRGKLALIFFGNCYKQNKQNLQLCDKKLSDFWQKDTTNAEIGIRLAELMDRHSPQSIENIWTFYKEAVRGELSKFYCQKKKIASTVTRKLVSIAARTTDDKNIYLKIDQEISGDCWNSIKDGIYQQLPMADIQNRRYLFTLLEGKGELSQKDRDLYHLVFILDSPAKGALLNRSWSTIKSLGSNYRRREQVLKNIAKLDPLPGDILSSFDDKKKQTIIKHLFKNVPEYFDIYAKTCLNFLSGKGNFPNGNPTIQCKQLFDLSRGEEFKNLVDPGLQIKYKKTVI